MPNVVSDRLKALSITLPQASAPAANYLPFTRSQNLLFISGQLPTENGKMVATGRLGADVSLEEGQKAARACAINIIAQINAALNGDLDRVKRILKLSGFVASAPEFTDQHLVINGASDLIADVFGEAGKHARAAVGMAALPLNASVEIDAIVEID
ncbi:RidA family protein [Martelella radicis]|uniref:Enamine deaminase RidA (YjgF/YER057c/UK114 family) n=1 Tax=Martelella radicis TaxID=1397476 RepID=A0A7W6KI44_9HYPH|nr:RidA family protein [Martelella radicis]MBB4121743.1 enamine deaminase RidA (YjgF/YER057c/UK114 family) [Martelella radicis]